MVFKFAYFVELWIDYQPAKFQCCRLSLASFIDRLRKHDETSLLSHFILLGFENLEFYETEYKLSPLRVSTFLVVWMEFYGRWCKTPKNTIMKSL